MIGIEPDMERKLASIGFRSRTDASGIGMRAVVEQVEIIAVESPLGLQLTFKAQSPRKSTQMETRVGKQATAQEIALVIVSNLEASFPEFLKKSQDRGEA